jgi:hypothetical protein
MINLSQNKAFEDFFNLVEDSFNIDSKDFGANPDEYRNLIQNYINDTLLTEYDNV